MKKSSAAPVKAISAAQAHSSAYVARLAALPATPWKNGGGVTRELARAELPDGSGFAWRLSMADIDQPGPFSDFKGYRRQLILLDGTGLELGRPGARGVRLDHPGDTHIFDGAQEISAALHVGPCRDVNIMTAHHAACHWEMQLLRDATLDIAGSFVLFPVQGWWEAHAADRSSAAADGSDHRGGGGGASADEPAVSLIAEPGTVLVNLRPAPASCLHCSGSGLAILLRLISHSSP
jgi:environmental stress-induced protein Ves